MSQANRVCGMTKLDPRRGNIEGEESPHAFGGLQRGFLIRSSEQKPQQQITHGNIGGLKKGFLLERNTSLSTGTRVVYPELRNKALARTQYNQSLQSPPRGAGVQLREKQQLKMMAAEGGIPNQDKEENRNRVKQKCKNLFKGKHNLRDDLQQMMAMDWKHPDVEAAINRHPRLHRQIRDPHLIHIMKWFHDDPEGFMQHFEESDEELIFIKDMLDIMEQHLQTHGNRSKQDFINLLGLSPDNEGKLNAISQNPEISSIINNPQFQDKLTDMSNNPIQAQRMLEVSDPEFRAQLMTLVSTGVMDILLQNSSSN